MSVLGYQVFQQTQTESCVLRAELKKYIWAITSFLAWTLEQLQFIVVFVTSVVSWVMSKSKGAHL